MKPWLDDGDVRLYLGDCVEVMRGMDAGSVQTCITSPPYWGLRDYGHAAQLGQENSPQTYIAALVAVFREVRRVMRDDGTLWLNLGDSYAAADTAHGLKHKDLVGIPWRVAFALQDDGWYLRSDVIWAKPNPMPESVTDRPTKAHEYIFLLAKSERYFYDAEAIKETAAATWNAAKAYAARQAMTAPEIGKGADLERQRTRGFGTHHEDRDRQDRNARSVWTITTKPYAGAHFATFPPELPERCIKAGTPEAGCCAECGAPRARIIVATSPDGRSAEMRGGKAYDAEGRPLMGDNMIDHGTRGSWNSSGATLRRETRGFRASCNCDADTVPAVVLDPFMGSGTVAEVARKLNRRAVGCELNEEYMRLAASRLQQLSLLSDTEASG